jgi:hypothetical protein
LVTPLTETREQASPCRVAQREKDFVELRFARAGPSLCARSLAIARTSRSSKKVVHRFGHVSARSPAARRKTLLSTISTTAGGSRH